LPEAGSVLDIGCGHGEPVTRVLTQEGLNVFALDASPRMVAAFEKRFPSVPVACEPAEESAFFGRSFDGVVAVGLLFLLDEKAQAGLIGKMAGTLKPGGSLLFSAPCETGTWDDLQTGRRSISLGEEAYRRLIYQAGLELSGMPRDNGGNQYWEAIKPIADA
jgi:2-polyprenyl-3-methyl-5-hydroxy-6-metoxy-1,4-benzoquinol methylase